MNCRAQIQMLPDGRRLHMQDGPIDVIVEAFGEAGEIALTYRAAANRFVEILDELCCELEFLRRPACEDGDLHYADGSGSRCGGRGNSRSNDRGRETLAGLRE